MTQKHNSVYGHYCIECDYFCTLGFIVVGRDKKNGSLKVLCEKCANERLSVEQLEEIGY